MLGQIQDWTQSIQARLTVVYTPLAVELGVRLTEVTPLDDDLESVFRYLVNR